MGCGQSKIHLYPRKSKSKANGKKSGHADSDAETDEDEGHIEETEKYQNREQENTEEHENEESNKEAQETDEEVSISLLRAKNLSLLQSQEISTSQQNFFRMLDQKIEDGPDYDSASETEIALEEARLNALVQHWESASLTASICSSASRSLQTTPIRQVPLKQLTITTQRITGKLLQPGNVPQTAAVAAAAATAATTTAITTCTGTVTGRQILNNPVDYLPHGVNVVAMGGGTAAASVIGVAVQQNNSMSLPAGPVRQNTQVHQQQQQLISQPMLLAHHLTPKMLHHPHQLTPSSCSSSSSSISAQQQQQQQQQPNVMPLSSRHQQLLPSSSDAIITTANTSNATLAYMQQATQLPQQQNQQQSTPYTLLTAPQMLSKNANVSPKRTADGRLIITPGTLPPTPGSIAGQMSQMPGAQYINSSILSNTAASVGYINGGGGGVHSGRIVQPTSTPVTLSMQVAYYGQSTATTITAQNLEQQQHQFHHHQLQHDPQLTPHGQSLQQQQQQQQQGPGVYYGELMHNVPGPSAPVPTEYKFPPAISVQRLAPQVQRQLRETQELIKDSCPQLYAAGYGSPGPPIRNPNRNNPTRSSGRPTLETQFSQELS